MVSSRDATTTSQNKRAGGEIATASHEGASGRAQRSGTSQLTKSLTWVEWRRAHDEKEARSAHEARNKKLSALEELKQARQAKAGAPSTASAIARTTTTTTTTPGASSPPMKKRCLVRKNQLDGDESHRSPTPSTLRSSTAASDMASVSDNTWIMAEYKRAGKRKAVDTASEAQTKKARLGDITSTNTSNKQKPEKAEKQKRTANKIETGEKGKEAGEKQGKKRKAEERVESLSKRTKVSNEPLRTTTTASVKAEDARKSLSRDPNAVPRSVLVALRAFLDPKDLREQLSSTRKPNVFEVSREGASGNLLVPFNAGKSLRKMVGVVFEETNGGKDTSANAEYLVQILEEVSINGGRPEVPSLAVHVLKHLAAAIKKAKPEYAVEGVNTIDADDLLDMVLSELHAALPNDYLARKFVVETETTTTCNCCEKRERAEDSGFMLPVNAALGDSVMPLHASLYNSTIAPACKGFHDCCIQKKDKPLKFAWTKTVLDSTPEVLVLSVSRPEYPVEIGKRKHNFAEVCVPIAPMDLRAYVSGSAEGQARYQVRTVVEGAGAVYLDVDGDWISYKGEEVKEMAKKGGVSELHLRGPHYLVFMEKLAS